MFFSGQSHHHSRQIPHGPKVNPVNMAQPHSMLPQPAVIETRPARMPLHKPERNVKTGMRSLWDVGETTIQSNPHTVSDQQIVYDFC